MLNLEPRHVWNYFERLSAIPRPSGHEAAAAAWVVAIAREHGLSYSQDAVGNTVVRVPATKGHEDAPVTVLQGHLDMVTEKNSGTEHDFATDPIRLHLDGDIVKATGTTLGADNGIGVSMALALLDEPGVVHGPLELLFTIDEERGLTGAKGLAPDFLTGRRLLNLDTEEDGAIYVGCAGGIDTTFTLPITRDGSAPARSRVALTVAGLRGGHSGCDIHEGRGNANRLLERTLGEVANAGVAFAVVAVEGGSKRNAIPREAHAVIDLAASDLADLRSAVARFEQIAKAELAGIDDRVTLSIGDSDDTRAPLDMPSAMRVSGLLAAVPHGAIAFSRAIPGLVETSTNFAVIATGDDALTVWTSQRSSVGSQLAWAARWVAAIGHSAGAEIAHSDGYPGWKPNLDSALLKTALAVYARENGVAPEPKAIHAGLECGLIGARYPGMDMVSIGPEVRNAHSPDEEVHVSSVARTWGLLKKVLAEMA